MKTRLAFFLSLLVPVVSGCGSGADSPPPQAVRRPPGQVKPSAPGAWTKERMIETVNKSPVSDAQKKAEIAKINAMPGG